MGTYARNLSVIGRLSTDWAAQCAESVECAQMGAEESARQHALEKSPFLFDEGAAGRPGAEAAQHFALAVGRRIEVDGLARE